MPSGVWTYNLNLSNVPAGVGSSNLPAISANAFGVWQSAQNQVSFARGGDTTVTRNKLDYKNIVAWGRTSGTALAVTYTRYYTSTGLVADVDTIMNQKFAWTWNTCSTSAYDAQDILTHELGHWMGLDDEYNSAYVYNTMYGYGSPAETLKDTLTSGDVSGLTSIY